MVNFISWEGPEANPSFLPEVLSSLEKPGATFISPFSGIEVSPLEYLSSDPISPIPPGKCLFQMVRNGKLLGDVFEDYSMRNYAMKEALRNFTDFEDKVYFIILTDKSEELWKSSGLLGKPERVFKRKRR